MSWHLPTWGWGLALALLGCHAQTRPSVAEASFTLEPGAGFWVRDQARRFSFDWAAPITQASRGCPQLEASPDTVRWVEPGGRTRQLPVAAFEDLTFQGVGLGALRVAVTDGEACEIVLGRDVLDQWVLELEPLNRRGALTKRSTGASVALEVSFEPTHDWPLMVVQLGTFETVLVAIATTGTSRARVARGPDPLALEVGRGLCAVGFAADSSFESTSLFGTLGTDFWQRLSRLVFDGPRRKVSVDGDFVARAACPSAPSQSTTP